MLISRVVGPNVPREIKATYECIRKILVYKELAIRIRPTPN